MARIHARPTTGIRTHPGIGAAGRSCNVRIQLGRPGRSTSSSKHLVPDKAHPPSRLAPTPCVFPARSELTTRTTGILVAVPRLLVVHHSPTARVRTIADAVLAGAHHEDLMSVEVVERAALEATVDDVLAAEGYVFGTTANFGYLSGALKHFFSWRSQASPVRPDRQDADRGSHGQASRREHG